LEKVIFKKEVLDYFDELVYVLFEKDYFSYIENAKRYVGEIIDFITVEIANFPHKNSPSNLNYLGKNYIFYKSNNRTTWFIFFEKQNDKYLITSIINNHCKEVNDL